MSSSRDRIIKSTAETLTGIRVVDTGKRIETYNASEEAALAWLQATG